MSRTLREKIQDRMSQLDIVPKRSLGQNFLVSDSVVDKIITEASPEKFDRVFEIGPGLGALTDSLISQSKNLRVVEFDRQFAAFWREKSVEVVEDDALKVPWGDWLKEEGRHLLVSNLPYQISSRLVVELSLLPVSFDRMVLMFQKEVGQRMMAAPGTSDYGLLTVVAQSFWKIRLVVEAGAVDFMPKPNVASRVLIFNRNDFQLEQASEYLNFLKLCFQERRKKLLPKLKIFRDREALEELFKALGLDPGIRAERLSPDEFYKLYTSLKKS
ncbi:MAG: 16S rRNA (adenine(1518)-N(6)/adenine(1519)-N(6))-dimethyltransferase RsmA [Pseudomonadota bacterium]